MLQLGPCAAHGIDGQYVCVFLYPSASACVRVCLLRAWGWHHSSWGGDQRGEDINVASRGAATQAASSLAPAGGLTKRDWSGKNERGHIRLCWPPPPAASLLREFQQATATTAKVPCKGAQAGAAQSRGGARRPAGKLVAVASIGSCSLAHGNDDVLRAETG